MNFLFASTYGEGVYSNSVYSNTGKNVVNGTSGGSSQTASSNGNNNQQAAVGVDNNAINNSTTSKSSTDRNNTTTSPRPAPGTELQAGQTPSNAGLYLILAITIICVVIFTALLARLWKKSKKTTDY